MTFVMVFREQLVDALSVLGTPIEAEVELGCVFETEDTRQPVAEEAPGVLEGVDALTTFLVGAEARDIDVGVPEIRRSVDRGDAGETDAGILDLPEDEPAELGPEKVRDSFTSTRHPWALRTSGCQ